ncbi:hypothetical protein TruAng_002801 [Truncatella angustata]|nr:hypothetical protein TruAng_002801 [Truncatella angustata]
MSAGCAGIEAEEDDDTLEEDSSELCKLLLQETIGRDRPKALCYEDILMISSGEQNFLSGKGSAGYTAPIDRNVPLELAPELSSRMAQAAMTVINVCEDFIYDGRPKE